MPENNQIFSVAGQLVGMPLAGPESFSQQQLDYLKRALGMDETVLYDDSNGQSTGTFSETISNFERIKVLYVWNSSTDNKAKYVELQAVAQVFSYLDNGKAGTTYNWFGWGSWEITTTGFSLLNGYQAIGGLSSTTPVSAGPKIYKVIGIHRIAGGN